MPENNKGFIIDEIDVNKYFLLFKYIEYGLSTLPSTNWNIIYSKIKKYYADQNKENSLEESQNSPILKKIESLEKTINSFNDLKEKTILTCTALARQNQPQTGQISKRKINLSEDRSKDTNELRNILKDETQKKYPIDEQRFQTMIASIRDIVTRMDENLKRLDPYSGEDSYALKNLNADFNILFAGQNNFIFNKVIKELPFNLLEKIFFEDETIRNFFNIENKELIIAHIMEKYQKIKKIINDLSDEPINTSIIKEKTPDLPEIDIKEESKIIEKSIKQLLEYKNVDRARKTFEIFKQNIEKQEYFKNLREEKKDAGDENWNIESLEERDENTYIKENDNIFNLIEDVKSREKIFYYLYSTRPGIIPDALNEIGITTSPILKEEEFYSKVNNFLKEILDIFIFLSKTFEIAGEDKTSKILEEKSYKLNNFIGWGNEIISKINQISNNLNQTLNKIKEMSQSNNPLEYFEKTDFYNELMNFLNDANENIVYEFLLKNKDSKNYDLWKKLKLNNMILINKETYEQYLYSYSVNVLSIIISFIIDFSNKNRFQINSNIKDKLELINKFINNFKANNKIQDNIELFQTEKRIPTIEEKEREEEKEIIIKNIENSNISKDLYYFLQIISNVENLNNDNFLIFYKKYISSIRFSIKKIPSYLNQIFYELGALEHKSENWNAIKKQPSQKFKDIKIILGFYGDLPKRDEYLRQSLMKINSYLDDIKNKIIEFLDINDESVKARLNEIENLKFNI